ncbi:MAG: phage antirepressor N-terminal domain-containing protein [Oscillospiraceae bacterium]|nr:phage antirepressor N-terminal domain-containing protein [Oscillospiraceae bacterium]
MNELEIKKVPFLGTELMAARDADGQIWVGVRRMCDGIGLSKAQSKSQVEKINEDKVLSKVDKVRSWMEAQNWPTTISAGGKNYPVLYREAKK